jgi:hypothetical protein
LVNVVLVLKVRVALRTHEVCPNLMSMPQSLALTALTILDIVSAAFAVEVALFHVIIEICQAIEVDLAVWTDIVMA